jgi:uncharacterized membrane protein
MSRGGPEFVVESNDMNPLLAAFLIGIVAGLRSMTAPAAVCWAAHLGRLHLVSSRLAGANLAWMGSTAAVWSVTALALGEIITDKLPKTPSRKAPGPFIARMVLGGLSGAAIGVSSGSIMTAAIAGAVGAVVGTIGGYEFRMQLVRATGGKDLPIALLEDAIAVGGAALILSAL